MPINTYLASFIFTVALIAPKMASESQLSTLTFQQITSQTALEAPKTAFLSVNDYAKKAAADAGIDPNKFLRLISCESTWKEGAVGDNNRSFGILQFQKRTFDRFSKKYGAEWLQISDSYDQIDLATLMIRDGYEDSWLRCGHKVGLMK